MTVRSERSNWTWVPICGTPAESRTTPETDPGAAPRRGALLKTISKAKTTSWSLRVVTIVGELAASLAIFFQFEPARTSESYVR